MWSILQINMETLYLYSKYFTKHLLCAALFITQTNVCAVVLLNTIFPIRINTKCIWESFIIVLCYVCQGIIVHSSDCETAFSSETVLLDCSWLYLQIIFHESSLHGEDIRLYKTFCNWQLLKKFVDYMFPS